MSLIVENGSVVTDAESYISVADAATYHADRGNTGWTSLTATVQEQCLRKATDFMLARYRKSWKGTRVKYNQALDWPRYDVVRDEGGQSHGASANYGLFLIPNNEIPIEVKRACAELAFRASMGPLIEDVPFGRVTTQETVGPLTVKYSDDGSYQPAEYKQVDMSLSVLLSNRMNGPMVKLNRV